MLNPSMQELMKRVGNRYLLVNLAAQRAGFYIQALAYDIDFTENEDHSGLRAELEQLAEEKGEPLPDKAVKLALDEIAAGKIVYRPGPRVETAIPQNNAIAAAMVDVDDTLDLDEDEEHTDSETDEDKDENADEVRRLNEFDDGSLSDGDIPEEDL